MIANNETAIFGRLIEPEREELTPDVARYILSLCFPKADQKRMNQLAAKARAGTLTKREDDELKEYLRAGNLVSLLKSRARKALKSAAHDLSSNDGSLT